MRYNATIMFIVVGLGNPGTQYEDTRHNAGRIVLSDFMRAHHFPEMVYSSKYNGSISEGQVDGEDVMILFPETFMNVSGSSVKKVVKNPVEAQQLVVVYDELDLPCGKFKLSYGRGTGGHNGLASVIKAIRTKDFLRIRIGISPKTLFGAMKRPSGEHASRYVLAPLTRRERAKLEGISEDVTKALTTLIKEGREMAMSEWN